PANLTCVTLQMPVFDFSSKTATDATGNGLVDTGEVVHYRIQALNSGTADGTGVVVTDPIPAGASFVPGTLQLDGVTLTDVADADAGEVAGGLVTVRVGTVPVLSFSTGVVTFDLVLNTPTGAQLCNSGALVDWAEAALCGGTAVPIPPA